MQNGRRPRRVILDAPMITATTAIVTGMTTATHTAMITSTLRISTVTATATVPTVTTTMAMKVTGTTDTITKQSMGTTDTTTDTTTKRSMRDTTTAARRAIMDTPTSTWTIPGSTPSATQRRSLARILTSVRSRWALVGRWARERRRCCWRFAGAWAKRTTWRPLPTTSSLAKTESSSPATTRCRTTASVPLRREDALTPRSVRTFRRTCWRRRS
mmetsp:Transcript_13977/g.24360  ORF Transcript_13977/g.24360 Transcript_13977/m.24360 type:complete len:215 (+) Transcript_13977:193-837(+)